MKPLNQNKMKQTAVEWLEEQQAHLFNQLEINEIEISEYKYYLDLILNQAKEMEKEQMKDAFVECWKSNVPDGIECKLDAEQYYNETFKSEQ